MDMPVVEFDTTFGQIKIELNAEKHPSRLPIFGLCGVRSL